jgi:uncharacterized membrane protein YphA (DoxX/SURF4 family)
MSWIAAVTIAVLFLASGLWKITDAPGAAVRMAQARVPESLSLAAAVLFGIAETFSGVLVLVPRFRRWGAILTGLLLVAFLIYFAVNYNALRGADCSCFPWIKRVVGPGFFIGDGIMLLLATLAGVWARPSAGLRTAAVILGAVAVFAVASYGVEVARQTGTRAPEIVSVEGHPYSIERGRVFLFFFHPQCMHCYEASRRMAQLNWGETRIVAIPVAQSQYAAQFLQETGLKAAISSDAESLEKTFGYTDYPFGVAVLNGREKAALTKFDEPEPAASLKQLGFVK